METTAQTRAWLHASQSAHSLWAQAVTQALVTKQPWPRVSVSDEQPSANNYSYYISSFQGLKDNPDDVIIHAIGGDYPSVAVVDPYNGFYEATVATGGLFQHLFNRLVKSLDGSRRRFNHRPKLL